MYRKFRSNIYFTRLIILAVLSLATTSVGSDARAEVKIELSETEFNYGQMPLGSRVKHTFWLFSTGTDTAFIDSIATSCGCTTIPLERDFIAPGDSLPLVTEFSTSGFLGRVVKRPFVVLKDDTTQYAFKFYADVIDDPYKLQPLAIFPPLFDLRAMTGPACEKIPFILENTAQVSIRLNTVAKTSDIVALTLPDTLAPGEKGMGELSLLEEFWEGSFLGSFTVEMNGSNLYRLTVPVFRSEPPTDTLTPRVGEIADSLFDASKNEAPRDK